MLWRMSRHIHLGKGENMGKITVKLTGVAPMLQHSGRLADPTAALSKEMKAVSSKRKKVDADYEEMARLEFLGSLYLNKAGKVIVPSSILDALIVGGAKKSRRGSDFKSQVFSLNDAELEYDGKPDLSGEALVKSLWADSKFRFVAPVKVGQARVMRTRPIFENWSLTATFEYFGEVDEGAILQALQDAGRTAGIGDWRPRYGRFTVEKEI